MEQGVSRSEELPDKGLGLLLSMAVQSSGCTRREVGLRSSIHKDALRRILSGNRSPTLGEASGICGMRRIRAGFAHSLNIGRK